jgi:D-aspartate ligase
MEMKGVVFGGHVQGLGIVRILGRMGFSVSLLDSTKNNIARHSKYCESFHLVQNDEIIPADEIIVQEIIPGGSHEQYSVGCLFNRTEPLASLVARRLRQNPVDFGNATTYAETVDNPELAEAAHILLKKIHYKGICEVEFKRDPRDNRFKLLEVNPRTWKWHTISEAANVPFIESYTNLLQGKEARRHHFWEHVSWSHYVTDIPVIIKMIVRSMYKKPNKKNHVRAVLQADDLMPALFELIYIPYLIKTR